MSNHYVKIYDRVVSKDMRICFYLINENWLKSNKNRIHLAVDLEDKDNCFVYAKKLGNVSYINAGGIFTPTELTFIDKSVASNLRKINLLNSTRDEFISILKSKHELKLSDEMWLNLYYTIIKSSRLRSDVIKLVEREWG